MPRQNEWDRIEQPESPEPGDRQSYNAWVRNNQRMDCFEQVAQLLKQTDRLFPKIGS